MKTDRRFAKIDEDGFISHPRDIVRTVDQHHEEYDMPVYSQEPDGEGNYAVLSTEHVMHDWTTERTAMHPTAQDYLNAKDGPWYPFVDQTPNPEEGFTFSPTQKGELVDGTIKRIYIKQAIVPSLDQYDSAMEQYLRDVRFARGYTSREPDSYLASEEPRWHQDAVDWVKFRDDVMRYGLSTLNYAKATGEIPSIEAFLSAMPQMSWTYSEEE